MITPESSVRWAANAPSAMLLAAAVRAELPSKRIEKVEYSAAQALEEGHGPLAQVWRIWPLDRGPVLFKHYDQLTAYHTEVCNLRYFNAIAREFTPRLVACDEAARSLLVDDHGGSPMSETEAAVGVDGARHTWVKVVRAIATIHVQAQPKMALLRRLYAPQWPAMQHVSSPDLLERAADTAIDAAVQPRLTVSERGALIAAGNWIHAHLSLAIANERAPILGLLSAHSVAIGAERITFTELTQAALGHQASDLAATWHLPDRVTLLRQSYLEERSRQGCPIEEQSFWETDAALVSMNCAARLLRLLEGRHGLVAIPPVVSKLLLATAHITELVPALTAAGAVLERIALGLPGADC